MVDTPLLGLPLLAAAQAQKHVTHNEALLLIDALVQLAVVSRALAGPPGVAGDGARYLVAPAATGDWAGHAGQIALREAGAWRFAAPREGWRLWVEDEDVLLVFTGTVWREAVLLNAVGGGAQIKINKQAAADTASLVCQTGFSGRAEMGLTGSDDFRVKVSPDGAAWSDAIVINRTTGAVSLPNTASSGVSDGDKGDITVASGGTVWTIDAGAVTTAKMGGDVTMAGKSLLTAADANAQAELLGFHGRLLAASLTMP